MRDLPTGTVTFLFTDIEGSTRLLQGLGDAYADALAEHRRVLREAFEGHGGVEVDTQGDAFFVAFPRAEAALAAAIDAREALEAGPVRVRMGLHTGEPTVTDEGYVGLDVHRAARIAAAGHGGQILVSQATRELLGGTELRDLGEHRLKDLAAPVRLFQAGDGEFPPLRTLFGTNLPVQPTSLVGRERELAEAATLLQEHRVVTLLGPGGSGKTRLALQLAAEAVEDFPDGVYWIPLQAVAEPELVEGAISRAIGASNGLTAHVGDKRMLLLADNFEHVLEAAPGIAELVAGTPESKLLVTSREPLRIHGEQRYPVDPLPDHDAVTLFLERARAVDPAFEADAAVQEICRRLDGLPLAIELAAARVNVLDASALAARLEQRLSLLTGGARDAPERQRTLRSTIEWSHELLDPTEQEAFRRLSVFAGSFELHAAGEVCDVGIDAVASLVEKSLVRRWGNGRFGMLDTIQEYARERLVDAGDALVFRRRHAEFFVSLAESAHLTTDAAELGQRFEIIQPELDNLRAALDYASAEDVVLALQLAIALEQFWVATAPHEGRARLERLLAVLPDDASPLLHARALRVLGGCVAVVGDLELSRTLGEETLAMYQELGDEAGIEHMLHRVANGALGLGELARARALSEQSMEIAERRGSRLGMAWSLGTLASIDWAEGQSERSFELARRSAVLASENGYEWWGIVQHYAMSERSRELRRFDDVERYARTGLAIAHRIGERQYRIYLLALLARAAVEQGRLERAGTIWGSVEAEERHGPFGQWEGERSDYSDPVLAHDGPELARGRERGRSLTIAEAVEYALDA